jgi:hypothetical protein
MSLHLGPRITGNGASIIRNIVRESVNAAFIAHLIGNMPEKFRNNGPL